MAETDSKWTQAEMQAAVDAYLWMLQEEQAGREYSKSSVNQRLREGALSNRTRASIEYRMQNISAVLEQSFLPRIKGYLPAKNVGNNAFAAIWEALEKFGSLARSDYDAALDGSILDGRVKRLKAHKLVTPPPGQPHPKSTTCERAEFFRDPAVKAWVLQNAKGVCELCRQDAPFKTDDGQPFLEHHHVVALCEDGADTVENSVALCPNCHRRCHMGSDREEIQQKLFNTIDCRVGSISARATNNPLSEV